MQTCGRQGHLFGLWKENNKVTILIDADGCPVVDLTVQIAAKYKVPVLILCDTAHQIQRNGAHTLTFDKGSDSVDFALVNPYTPRQSCNYVGLRTGKYVSGTPRSRAEPKRLRVYARKYRRPAVPPPQKQKAPPCRKAPQRGIQTNEGAGHNI